MDGKHKNALIGALLAVVFVMAVGYAAFAQLLTINGTAQIDSTWDVHFDPNQSTSTAVAIVNGGPTGATDPSGTITYSDSQDKPTVADLAATLKQPGDTVTFTLKPTNYGSISATPASNPVITYGTNEDSSTMTISNEGRTATKGNIQWDIIEGTTVSDSHTITGSNGGSVTSANQDTIVVRATFTGGVNQAVTTQTANIKIAINYQQAA